MMKKIFTTDLGSKKWGETMKVLLVYPYHTAKDNVGRWYPAEPLGLLYLATYLQRAVHKDDLDIQIRILDCQFEGPTTCTRTARGYRSGMTDIQIRDQVAQWVPDVVGITNNYTFGTLDAQEVAATIKAAAPNAVVVMGGAHASIDDIKLASEGPIDAVVRGEGEETFREMCYAIYRGMSFDKIIGITCRTPDGIRQNPARPHIENLDTLPIPDRSFINYPDYLSKPQYAYPRQSPVGTVSTSRGCPFRCVFCSTQKVWGNKWRGRSAESMLQEVEYLHKTYAVREIAFQDDQFLGNRDRIIEFCRKTIERKLHLTYIVPPGNSPAFMNADLVRWMAKAGFYRLCFSVDVGTESSAKYVRKPVKLNQIRGLVKLAHRHGIWTYGTFVIGFPDETREDILATIAYAYSLKLDLVRFYIAQPHLGSDLYGIYADAGWLNGVNVNEAHHPGDAFFGTRHVSAEELMNLRNMAEGNYLKHYWKNYLNPFYLATEFLPKIGTWPRFRYFTGLLFKFFEFFVQYERGKGGD